MHQKLYFICPSDQIESIINKAFKNVNYFYTSLGNSVVFNIDTISDIENFIQKNDIREVYFILSDDNTIILDALKHQGYSHINRLKAFYNYITLQKEQSEVFWQTEHLFSVLSYHLNSKIKELEDRLGNSITYPININGSIYERETNNFKTIYSDLICLEKHNLN